MYMCSAFIWMWLQLHSMVLHVSINSPDMNAMLLPGHWYKDSDVKLLPSSTSKHAIWELYIRAATTSLMRALAYSTFTQLWRQLLPNMLVMKLTSDLCWVCQQNITAFCQSPWREVNSKYMSYVHASVEYVCTRWALVKHTIIHCTCRQSGKQSATS